MPDGPIANYLEKSIWRYGCTKKAHPQGELLVEFWSLHTLCALCGAHVHIWAPTDTIFNFAPYSSKKWLDW